MKTFTLLAATAAGLSTMALAQTERDLESHVHGSATMNVALDDTTVFLELDTPWNNLVGFEHKPGTDEEQALVKATLDLLNQSEKLFLFTGGDCTATDVHVESNMTEPDHEDDHKEAVNESTKQHEEEHKEDHKEDTEHGEHEEHKEDSEHAEHEEHEEHKEDSEHGEHEEHEEDTHTTALISYTYVCKNITQLTSIDVELFSVWPGFDDLDVQLIGPGGQALAEINADQSVLDITQVQ